MTKKKKELKIPTSGVLSLSMLKIIVVGDQCWGEGKTYRQAMRNCCRENKAAKLKHHVYLVHPNTVLDDMGDWVTTDVDHDELLHAYQPHLIHSVGFDE